MKSWVVYEQRNNGDGSLESFDTREEAMRCAEDRWGHLTEKEKDNRIVEVFQTSEFDDNGNGIVPEDGYDPVWYYGRE